MLLVINYLHSMKKHTLVGIFDDSKHAGEAISELKEMGYSKDISVVAKHVNKDDIDTHDVKRDLGHEAAKGAGTGAVVGGTLGAIAGLLAGAASVTVPGLGIAVAGPLVAALTGAGAGGAAGTLLGALIDMGIPENRAKEYQQYVDNGQTLVTVTVHPKDADKAEDILTRHLDMQDTGNESQYVAHYQY